jgi:diacylglycerol kinase (CTP)
MSTLRAESICIAVLCSYVGIVVAVYSGINISKDDDHHSTHSLAHISLIALVLSGIILSFRSLSKSASQTLIHSFGVSLQKIARTSQEIERKTFHLTGLGVPIFYEVMVTYFNWTRIKYVRFCWMCTAIIWIGDLLRVYVHFVNAYPPYTILNKVLREKERNQLSGTCYFSLGCSIVISLYSREVANIAISYLVLGDMAAALFGVSFGGDMVVVKMGRLGKKSVEGSFAMFIVCTLLGLYLIEDVYLVEYAVVLGSFVATIVELYEPFHLNDNLTIPFATAATMSWALERIKPCQTCQLI